MTITPATISTERPSTAVAAPKRRRQNPVLGLLAWVIGLLFVAPVLWMILTSLHGETDAAKNPPAFSAPLTLNSYANFFGAATGASPWPPLINSATASIMSTIFVLALSIPAAYALSIRPVRKWTDVLFFFLSTKMLPAVAGLLPIYLIVQKVGMLDNVYTLVILYTSMNLPIAVWMMRSFQLKMKQISDVAAMPGRMIGIAATSLICFIFSWNELLFARVLTGTVAQTAPVFLTGFVTSQGLFLAKVCAAAFVVSLPVIIAGFAAQDKLVQGLSLGAVK